ncbi:hypothetical protein B0H17DRAFT_1219124 [Mycena rosella]|uniref:Uncharacterized protein n=1 Tax=Mycena rosella TaxID=1033263 RepID=A0AAD7BJT2_MYCRO|nr:hypothetical protein B0H17DRAFT_1219124 [Mycena rosella]
MSPNNSVGRRLAGENALWHPSAYDSIRVQRLENFLAPLDFSVVSCKLRGHVGNDCAKARLDVSGGGELDPADGRIAREWEGGTFYEGVFAINYRIALRRQNEKLTPPFNHVVLGTASALTDESRREALVQDRDELIVCRGVDEDVFEKDHDSVREEAQQFMLQIQEKSIEYEPEHKLSLILGYIPGRITNTLDRLIALYRPNSVVSAPQAIPSCPHRRQSMLGRHRHTRPSSDVRERRRQFFLPLPHAICARACEPVGRRLSSAAGSSFMSAPHAIYAGRAGS